MKLQLKYTVIWDFWDLPESFKVRPQGKKLTTCTNKRLEECHYFCWSNMIHSLQLQAVFNRRNSAKCPRLLYTSRKTPNEVENVRQIEENMGTSTGSSLSLLLVYLGAFVLLFAMTITLRFTEGLRYKVMVTGRQRKLKSCCRNTVTGRKI